MEHYRNIQNQIETGNAETVAELNDYAVRSLRGFQVNNAGTVKAMDLHDLLLQERERVHQNPDIVGYLKCSRSGARYRLSRKARSWVWMIFKTRERLSDMGVI